VADTNKGRIGLFLKTKCSVHHALFFSRVFDGGDFPTIVDKEELVFGNGHYYL
jgi:hypothetical protein